MQRRIEALHTTNIGAEMERKVIQDAIVALSVKETYENRQFQIVGVLTEQDIRDIPLWAWVHFMNKTKSMDDPTKVINVMFSNKAKPITQTECILYRLEIQSRIGNNGGSVLLNALVKWQYKIRDDMPIYGFTRLEQMERRINALLTPNTDADKELNAIHDAIPLVRDEEKDESAETRFPIADILTEQEVMRISLRTWVRLWEKTKSMSDSTHVINAMFSKKAKPITNFECELYGFEIEGALGHKTGSVLISALIDLQTRILDMDPSNIARLRLMRRRIETLETEGLAAVQELRWIRDKIAEFDYDEEERRIDEASEQKLQIENLAMEEEEEDATIPRASSPPSHQEEHRRQSNTPKSPKIDYIDDVSLTPVTSIDTTQPLLSAPLLRKLFDGYLRHVEISTGVKRFPVSPDFLNMLNQRLYEWVSDVMHLLSVTSQDSDPSKSSKCMSTDINKPAVLRALKLTNPGMKLSKNRATSLMERLIPNVSIPEPRRDLLVRAMLFYTKPPRRRITVDAYQLMATALVERLCNFVVFMSELIFAKEPFKLAVCPSFTTHGRVPANKPTGRYF